MYPNGEFTKIGVHACPIYHHTSVILLSTTGLWRFIQTHFASGIRRIVRRKAGLCSRKYGLKLNKTSINNVKDTAIEKSSKTKN